MKKTTLVMVMVLLFMALGLSPAYSQKAPTLPSGLEGTWKKDNLNVTLTFTATTLKASNANYTLTIKRISRDNYLFIKSDEPDAEARFTIKLEKGDLVMGSSNNVPSSWIGTWKKAEQQTEQQQQTNTAQQPQNNNEPNSGDDFEITQNEKGGITIYGYKGKRTQVIIPATIEGIKVTEIGWKTFADKSITSVIIPNSVTIIGDRAFLNCGSLTSVTIGNGVTTIELYAFQNCTSLTSITIPNSVTTIVSSAFEYCTSLASVTIPNSVTSIKEQTFKDCRNLTSVTIGNGVKSIGSWAFAGCTSLASVTIPNSVTIIDHNAFNGCSSLANITIPNSVTSIDFRAFYGCTSLASITIGANKNYADLNAPVKTKQNGSQNYPFANYTLCNAITIKNAKTPPNTQPSSYLAQ